jgi:hypothetical protein
VIVRHILNLNSRGFPPSLHGVRAMTNKLLAERGAKLVGKRWPQNFVQRTESPTTCFNRPYDWQRAQCEDPIVING